MMPNMLSLVEEEQDPFEVFPPHVDTSGISTANDLGGSPPPGGKCLVLKAFAELQTLAQTGRKRELKAAVRDNAWPVNSPVRPQLWPLLCRQHANDKSLQEGFYWDMVNQLYGTTDISDKPIMLPPFVEPSHCMAYQLTRRGRAQADRVVSVLGYACPDITYSPALYPITALLLHFMSGKNNQQRLVDGKCCEKGSVLRSSLCMVVILPDIRGEAHELT
uniref:Rab-GAP TBC domain-containing protein n=1 Tax=Timema tahoe TaxID=61484 RepID=A0A7R9IHJ6_9NEOP|nr:unnamed protein product [Timema tahoe]